MRFAYADPPYFGMGRKMYGGLHPEAGVWDSREAHVGLLRRLEVEYPDGWVLSCNPRDLWWLLPAAAHPERVRVSPWVKTWHQIRATSVQYAWEPVLWSGGRDMKDRKPMVRDWLMCRRSFQKGTPGAKPDEFNEWVLELLGYDPDEDTIDDLFPGSGGLTAATNIRTLF